MKNKEFKIAIICGYGTYFGSGHFIRMQILNSFLKEQNFFTRFFMIENKNDIVDLDLEDFDLIIKDSRDGNKKIQEKLKNKYLILFDDYYEYDFKNFKFLYYINSLPGIKKFGNITSFDYLLLNENIDKNYLNEFKSFELKQKIDNKNKEKIILVSFGKIDPHKMVLKFLKFIRVNIIINFLKENSFYLFILKPKYFGEKEIEKYKNDKILNKYLKFGENFYFIENEEDYYFIFKNCDFFISHPGLSLYEALKYGKEVFIISPTLYHYEISKRNFYELNHLYFSKFYFLPFLKNIFLKKPRINFVKSFIKNKIVKNNDKKIIDENKNVKNLILNLIFFLQENVKNDNNEIFPTKCPFCLSKKLKIIYYNKNYNLFKCNFCKSLIKVDIVKNNESHYQNEEYFKENYKERYGKSYLEDRENIRIINKKRIEKLELIINKKLILEKKIESIINKNLALEKKTESEDKSEFSKEKIFRILDIGCGYGFLLEDFKEFLSPKLEEYGYKCQFYGIEINPIAKENIANFINFYNTDFDNFYNLIININVKNNIEIKNHKRDKINNNNNNYGKDNYRNNNYEESYNNLKLNSFDLISATFLIEHIKNVEEFIFKVSNLLKENGLLLLAFPNSYGPTFCFNKDKYINSRPEEHYYDITLKGIKEILEKNKFKIILWRIPEHHYDRWKEKNKLFSLFIKKKLYNFIANKLGFSDTIEVYCKKY